MSAEGEGGVLVRPLLFLLFLGWLSWRLLQRRRLRRACEPVDDEPEGTPYRVYADEFDRVATARDVTRMMRAEDHEARIGPPKNVASWPERVFAAKRWASTNAGTTGAVADRFGSTFAVSPGDLAVLVLIDHSGSMKDNMVAVAATMRWLSALFDEHAIPLAIAGFTTVGWRGGAARRRWIAEKRPKRPGRLCATLHLIYRDFDGPLDDEDWRVMLDPAMLRENVDGEAIEWAVATIAARPERSKVVIVVSDGAPVDDSTIMENGPDFLARHARKVIAETQDAGFVRLGAVGINHKVDQYYRNSTWTDNATSLPSALIKAVIALVDDRSAR